MEQNKSFYLLTSDAESDLFEIAEYTLKNWGIDALHRYQKELTFAFESIANGTALNRQPFTQLPEVHISKSQKHFIFYIF